MTIYKLNDKHFLSLFDTSAFPLSKYIDLELLLDFAHNCFDVVAITIVTRNNIVWKYGP